MKLRMLLYHAAKHQRELRWMLIYDNYMNDHALP